MIALQSLIGNRATGQLVARLRSQDALPEHAGVDVAPLLAAQVPELLPLIPADQIEAMQKLYDADASNKELDRRHAQRRSDLASGRIPGVLVDEAGEDPDPNAVKGHYQAVQGPLSFEVRTEDVLADDILEEQPKNKAAEAAFRKWMRDELLKHPAVHVSIDVAFVAAYLNNGSTGTTNEAVLHWGSRALPHTHGKVHFKNLVEEMYTQEYHDRVTNSPELLALKNAIFEIEEGISNLELEHQNRIEKNHDHPVVRRVAEVLGGGPDMVALAELMIDAREHPEKGTFADRQEELSNECPDLDIWTEPKLASRAALDKLNDQELEVGMLAYMRAQNSFDHAARRFERYEDRVMKGAGIAVKWLNRAKVAGKLAAGALAGGGILDAALMAGSYSFVQEGAQQAAEVAEGDRKQMDWAGLTKGAAAEGAMALFGGVTQGAFTRAIEARVVERWGAEALADGGTRLVIGGTAAAASSFYNVGANMAVQKIIYGKANMPQSVDELATMVLDEASTAILTDAGMQGVHHAFGEHPGAAALGEGAGEHEGNAGTGGAAGPAEGGGRTGTSGGTATESANAPDRAAAKHLELVELAESAMGSPGSAAKLLDHFGSWDNTIGALREGAGDFALMDPAARATAIEGLVGHREQVAAEVAGFGAMPEGGKDALGKPENTAELTVKGNDAGLKAAQAIEHLDSAHPDWQRRFRMGVEVDAGRAKSISDSMAALPRPLRQELTRYQAESAEMLSTWREARTARTPELREAILDRIHGPEFKAWAKQMVDITPADAAAQRVEHLVSSDRAFEKIEPGAAGDLRFAQIKKAMDEQMLASALEPEVLRVSPPPGEDVSAAPAGKGPEHPLERAGSATERGEARQIVDSMEQLGSQWANLPVPARLEALARISNRALAARGVPNVRFTAAGVSAGTGGHFEFRTWEVVVDSRIINADSLDPNLSNSLGGLDRHEVDHTIQWWEMARLRASEGDDAATIHAKTSIDMDVAVQAVEIVKRDGPPSAEEKARAQGYWDSVYGQNKPAREWTLGEREELSKRRNELKAKVDDLENISGKEYANVLAKQAEVDEVFKAVDFMYKSLPEEHQSFAAEAIVDAEASLMTVEREFEFAEIAVRHAEDVLHGIEDRLLTEIANERSPSPELQADHNAMIARVKQMHARVEELEARRRSFENYAGGGAAPGKT